MSGIVETVYLPNRSQEEVMDTFNSIREQTIHNDDYINMPWTPLNGGRPPTTFPMHVILGEVKVTFSTLLTVAEAFWMSI